MVIERRCSAQVYGPRVHSWNCQRRGVIVANGKWYCRQHDPDAERQRVANRDAAWAAQKAEDAAIQLKAEAYGQALGCPSVQPDYNANKGCYIHALVISFEDAEQLVKRLQAKEQS